MRLIAIDYSEHVGQPQEWALRGLTFGERTLLAGRNATGKSRALSVINALSESLLGLRPLSLSGDFRCEFEEFGNTFEYSLLTKDMQVTEERFFVNGQVKLVRGSGGIGRIYAETLKGDIEFQAPSFFLAAVARRDSIQHPFLDALHRWASSVRYFQFGSELGKRSVAFLVENGPQVNDRDPNQIVGIFRKGRKEFSDACVAAVVAVMEAAGYDLTEIDVGSPISIQLQTVPNLPFRADPSVLIVKESDLPGFTDQFGMSQGMFRVLALLIHVNYLSMIGAAGCIIIDDIGEGLDYERSCQLINVLREKSLKSRVQLIFSTNDRFVMNEVPLEEWAILIREKNHVSVKNYENSEKEFENLRFTGLSNFSLFELGLLDGRVEGD